VNSTSAHFHPWLGVAAWLAISPVFAADSEPVKIEAREPRVQIRAEILKETTIGSSPDDVLKFINERFKPAKDTPVPKLRNHPAVGPTAKDSDKKGVQSIRLILGQYLTSPALFLMEVPMIAKTTTSVQWAFNKEGKLIELFVDKDSELGDQKGPDD
jgi:hypothetical protein